MRVVYVYLCALHLDDLMQECCTLNYFHVVLQLSATNEIPLKFSIHKSDSFRLCSVPIATKPRPFRLLSHKSGICSGVFSVQICHSFRYIGTCLLLCLCVA